MTAPEIPYALLPLRPGVAAKDAIARARPTTNFSVEPWTAPLPRQLDLAYAESAPDVRGELLAVRGPEVEWLGYLTAPELAQQLGREIGPSISWDRLVALTELVLSLRPFASAVIQPMANHMAIPSDDFARDAEEFLAGPRANPAALWAYPKTWSDRGVAVLETSGMAALGLAELAMPIPFARAERDQSQPYRNLAHSLMTAMLKRGPGPLGAVAKTSLGAITFERELHGALWCVPEDRPREEVAIAAGRIGRRRALSKLLGPHTHFHLPDPGSAVSLDHFHLADEGLAVTNGLSETAQPGGVPGDRNQHVELLLKATSPRADQLLKQAALAIHAHDAQRPIRELDRIVFPAPHGEIVAAVIWPFGHLNPGGGAQERIHLWLLIPLIAAELERFRGDPNAQANWIREREDRRDVHLFEERWSEL